MATRQRTVTEERQVNVGRPSKYPGKNRGKPIQIYMTNRGLEALERGTERTGLSRPDYIERLVLADDGRSQPRA